MGILLAFAPFIVFAVLDRIVGPVGALTAGAGVSAALVARDLVGSGRSMKILEFGTLILFSGLALYTALSGADWSVIGVRLCVDAGLLAVVLASMAAGRPFTLQYAREQVSPQLWDRPEFIRTNYVITGAWALAFLVMVAAEMALLYVPGLPPRAGIVAIIVALVGAIKFTGWYPERNKQIAD
jgi:enhancing lycopene biosynthesis protein 2